MSMIPTYHRGKRDFGTGYEMMEAIEALEAELLETRADAEAARSRAERYRVALEEIANAKPHHAGQTPNEYHFQEKARAALSDGGENAD